MFFGHDHLLRSLLVEVSFKVSVDDGVEGVLDRVDFRALILQQTRGTEVIVRAVLVISIGDNMEWIRAYLALESHTLDTLVAAVTAYMLMSVLAGPRERLRLDWSWLRRTTGVVSRNPGARRVRV
jgi:hypothetical protein